jgi:hypothetical protein
MAGLMGWVATLKGWMVRLKGKVLGKWMGG